MWSAPLKRTALDGTEYNLLLLDSEGIDAYDQTVRLDLVTCCMIDIRILCVFPYCVLMHYGLKIS